MEDEKYMVHIIQNFTQSINNLNQSFGTLSILLGEMNRKLDNIPGEDLFKELRQEWRTHLEESLDGLEVGEKFELVSKSMDSLFKDLRRDMAKYEELVEMMKNKMLKEMCVELSKEEMQNKIDSEIKLKNIDHKFEEDKEKNNHKFELILKVMTGAGILSFAIFETIKKFYFGM